MSRKVSRFVSFVALFALLLTALPALAQKGKKPGGGTSPPPGVPTFDIQAVPGVLGVPVHLNDAGDMAMGEWDQPTFTAPKPMAYLNQNGGIVLKLTDLLDPAVASEWQFVALDVGRLITESDGSKTARFVVRAKYLGDDPNLQYVYRDDPANVRNNEWMCRLDCRNVEDEILQTATFRPILRVWSDTLGGATRARDMNDLGVICGYQYARAFVMWPNDTQPTFLFDEPGAGEISLAHGINYWGQVVGRKGRQAFRHTPGYLNPDGEDDVLLLNGLVNTTSTTVTLSEAQKINDSGHFTGEALGKVTATTSKGKNPTTTYTYERYTFHYVDEPFFGNGQWISGMDGLHMLDGSYVNDISNTGDIIGHYNGGWGKTIYLHDQYILLDLVVGFSVFGDTNTTRFQNTWMTSMNSHRHIAAWRYESENVVRTYLLKPRP